MLFRSAFNDKKLEEQYNFEDALAMGMFFNSFFRHADVVKMANLAQMVNVIAPIMTNKQGLYLQPIYFPIAEYGKQRGNVALDAWVKAPMYAPNPQQSRRQISYLDVSATYNARDHTIFLNVLNRSKDKDIATSIENAQGQLQADIDMWQMNHPDLKAVHMFGDDRKVVPTTRQSMTVQGDAHGFSYTFPAHSLTVLKLKVD